MFILVPYAIFTEAISIVNEQYCIYNSKYNHILEIGI